jgi:hypothetical protein
MASSKIYKRFILLRRDAERAASTCSTTSVRSGLSALIEAAEQPNRPDHQQAGHPARYM